MPSTLLGVETTVVFHLVAYAGLAGAVGDATLAADGRTPSSPPPSRRCTARAWSWYSGRSPTGR
jgi:hypothetical protein